MSAVACHILKTTQRGVDVRWLTCAFQTVQYATEKPPAQRLTQVKYSKYEK